MVIPVACTCGKLFSALDEQAGAWTHCPACGRAVAVPGRLTPEAAAARLALLVEEDLVFLDYPFHVWRSIALLGSSLGIFAALTAMILPRLSDLVSGPAAAAALWAGLVSLLLAAYALDFLHRILKSALAGEHLETGGPFNPPRMVLRSCLIWLSCFLAGPALYAGAACWYWIWAGKLDQVDTIIIIQLGLFALFYWLIELLAAIEHKALFAGPGAVADRFRRLGFRGALLLLSAPIVAYLPARWALDGLEEFHRDRILGVFQLALAGVINMTLATLYLRYLGQLACRSRNRGPRHAATQDRQDDSRRPDLEMP